MEDRSFNTDTDILKAIAHDDQQAFALLYRKYHQKLFYFILHFTQSQPAAEDVLQEVFVKIWTERKNLGQVAHFNAWIFRVARNHVLNSLKRMAHETLILEAVARDMQTGVNDTYALLSYKDIYAVLHTGMNELPAQQKRVMELSREEGLKYDEIGRQLNISPATVKKHAAQALQYLREKIKRHYSLPTVFFSVLGAFQKYF